MSTTFLLIRHAAHLLGGQTIAGRAPGVSLSPEGERQAVRLAQRLAPVGLDALYTSPVERARQTAAFVASATGLEPRALDALAEIDFGEWTGRRLDDLRPLEAWQRWNAFRSGARAPGGELMLDVQARIAREMLRLAADHPDQTVALVSHGDIIKSATAYFLGVPLDLFLRIEISLASVTTIRIGPMGPWVLGVNSGDQLIPA